MGKPKREQCPVVYQGKSFPRFHGTRCLQNTYPHPGERHFAKMNGDPRQPLWWWTEEEKAALRG